MGERDLLAGLIRLHILHHAAHEAIFGLGIIEELGRHGYRLSAGTLYPLLHGLERSGHLRSRTKLVCGRQRRLYVATKRGLATLALAKTKVWELFRELFEDELRLRAAGPADPARSTNRGRTQAPRGNLAPGRRLPARSPFSRGGMVKDHHGATRAKSRNVRRSS